MYNEHRIAVVIPAYKESKLILSVLESIPPLVDDIIVVDDGSGDDTADKVRTCQDPRVKLIVHEVNKGVGAAIVTGHKEALNLGADVSVIVAGDAQADPSYLPDLLDPVTQGGYGFAKANRFFSSSSYEGMPAFRVVGSIVLTFLNKASSGYWNIVDPQNGYTAVRADVLRRMDLDQLAKRYDFENDMLNWLNILDVPAVDVNVPAVYGEETSTMSLWRDGWKIFARLNTGFWRRMWRKYVLWSFSPVALFLIVGMLLLLFALVATILAIPLHSPTQPLPTATVLLAVIPGMTGFYLLVQALMLDIQATPKPQLFTSHIHHHHHHASPAVESEPSEE